MASFRELAARLFGLGPNPSDTQRRFAAHAGQLILADLIDQCIKTAAKEGPGVLVVNNIDGADNATWATPDLLKANLAIAEEHNDTAMIDLQRRCIDRLGTLDPEQEALLLIFSGPAGAATGRLFELDRDRDPQSILQRLKEVDL